MRIKNEIPKVGCLLGLVFCLAFLGGCGSILYAQKSLENDLKSRLTYMLETDSADTLRSLLSDRFAVGPYTGASALSGLNAIAGGLKYGRVRVKKAPSVADHKALRVVFSKGNQKDKESTVVLDSMGKILYFGLFDKFYGMNRQAKSKLVAEIPFETDPSGAVVLRAKFNNSDRVLNLLFDTGADGMALPADLADSLGIRASESRSTSVVGGHTDIKISRGNTVHLGAFSFPDQSIALFEKLDKYDGIIGNTLLKRYIVGVDYDRKLLSIYTFGDFSLKDHLGDEGRLVDVSLPAGVVILPGNLSVTKGKSYQGSFVFDLGAAYSLICFRPFVKHNRLLVDGFQPTYSSSTTSMGMTTPTFTGVANSFKFGDMPEMNNFDVTLMSGGGQSESWNPGFDGSIGSRLISKYNFIVDMQAKKILFKPNRSFGYPNDFVRSGLLFGFSPDGALHFLHIVGRSASSLQLKNNTEVLSINGFSARTLREEPQKMQQVLQASPESKLQIEYIDDGFKKTGAL